MHARMRTYWVQRYAIFPTYLPKQVLIYMKRGLPQKFFPKLFGYLIKS